MAYGPRFVRANELAYNGVRTCSISGISSIGRDGLCVNGGIGELVDHTMTSFTDLLTMTGMAVADIAGAYVYCKGGEVRAVFEEYIATRRLVFPHMVNLVDVCRPELVFEIEARAMRPVGSPRIGP